MGWQFWKRRQNPLDTESLRELYARAGGDLRAVSEELKRRRQQSRNT